MKLTTRVTGAEVESSSIDSITASGSLEAKVRSVTIEQIAGTATLRSKLESGRISLSFSPHFSYGFTLASLATNNFDDPIDQKLRELGYSDEQIDKIAEIIGTTPLDIETKDIVPTDSIMVIGDQRHQISTKLLADSLTFGLPDIPINLDQGIDVRNLAINDLGFSGQTPINVGRVETTTMPLGDMEYTTGAPDILRFTTAEINEARLQPIDIPKLSLPDLGTSINIDKFGSTEIPLDVESTNGGSDINLPILDWHPRWRQEVCIKVWRYKKCVYVEFGVNLNISLYYRWSMTLLKFKMAIRNAFVNGVTVTVKASSILLSTIHIGLLRTLRIVSSVIQ